MKLLFNPFEKIAGVSALCIGLLFILAASYAATLNGIHFDGMWDVHLGASTGFVVPFVESFFNLLVINILALPLCKIFSKTHFRVIDVIGTTTLSRAPMLIASLVGFVGVIDRANPYTLTNFLIGFSVLFLVIWSIILLFNSLKVSANLKETPLWIVFLIVVVGGEIITKLLINKIYLLVL